MRYPLNRPAGQDSTVTLVLVLRILLVEDDDDIRVALGRALTQLGDIVAAVAGGAEAIGRLKDFRPDAVILDLGLPDLDGADVLAMIRSVSSVPVLVATARDDEQEIVRLLNAGADDYIVKPYSAAQLRARVRAVLRRGNSFDGDDAHAEVQIGGLVIDPRGREARLDGRVLVLTRKEFDVLYYLAQRKGEVVSKQVLLADVWQLPWGGGDRTVDVHLSWLRRKLGETAAEPVYLHSVRGVGVKLVSPG